MNMTIRPPTLYVTRNGLLEPLGQSQVLAYLRDLSRDHAVTLITHEKPQDMADRKAMASMHEICAAHGIRWQPQRFRARPKYIASAFGVVWLVWLILRAIRRDGVRLVHARSYIPAAAAWCAGRVTGVPFIFDMRALWPEELITAGRLARGSMLHRAIAWIEAVCIRDAAAVISLTHAGADYLRKVYADFDDRKLVVIPTCADLERFSFIAPRDDGMEAQDILVHGCIGTVLSGWFLTDWLSAWYLKAATDRPMDRFEIITRDDPQIVRSRVDPQGLLGRRLTIRACLPAEMPETIREHDVSVMYYAGGAPSELGRSPTRLAEVLGVGRPVIVNEGVGDVADIVRTHRVGVVLAGKTPAALAAAMSELQALRSDPDLAARCRRTAENLFSLPAGASAYREVYRDILAGRRARHGART